MEGTGGSILCDGNVAPQLEGSYFSALERPKCCLMCQRLVAALVAQGYAGIQSSVDRKSFQCKWRVVGEVSVSVDALVVGHHSRQDAYFV